MRPLGGLALAAALAGCSDDGPLGTEPPDFSGRYAVTFAATQVTACGGFVEPDSTDGVLPVIQAGTAVTLQLTEVTPVIRNDPTGTIDAQGRFNFSGPIDIGSESAAVTANGTITGTFGLAGVDLAFDFTAAGCRVQGTISGVRTGSI